MMTELPPLDSAVLPAGMRARFVENVNGLRMHVLEAGFEKPGRPCLLLLHGFPELAYSWRKVMGPLAAAGFHVVAPDQRGYGRTTGWDRSYDGDVASFRLFNLVRDALGLVAALGYRSVWRGHRMIAIGFITFACLIAGVAIEAAKNNQNAEATEVLRQPQLPRLT